MSNRMTNLGTGHRRLTPEQVAREREEARLMYLENTAQQAETDARYGHLYAKSREHQQRRRASLAADQAEAAGRVARAAQARAERPANIRLIQWAVAGALAGAIIRYWLVGRLW